VTKLRLQVFFLNTFTCDKAEMYYKSDIVAE